MLDIFLSWFWDELLITMVSSLAIAFCAARFFSSRHQPPWLLGCVAAALVAFFSTGSVVKGAGRFPEQVAIAERLGVDLRTYPTYWRFPADYLVQGVVPGTTTREEVRRLMEPARARFRCIPVPSWSDVLQARDTGDQLSAPSPERPPAEKYLFLSSESEQAQVVVVRYDGRGVVERRGLVGSSDPETVTACVPF